VSRKHIELDDLMALVLSLTIVFTFFAAYPIIKDQNWGYLAITGIVTFIVMWSFIYSVYVKPERDK
jgi:hypothetical protein